MDDTISRQAAIDAVYTHFGFDIEEEYGSAVQEVINGLPPAQPETHDKRTETHSVCLNAIDRQAAIDALSYCQTYLFDSRDDDKKISLEDAEYAIEQLQPAQPTYTDAEIQKMQDIEQAQIEKAHQLGYEEGKKDAQPKTGKWEIYVISMFDGEGCRCSECGFEGVPYWDFCPNCGCRMLKEGDTE